MNDTDFSFAAAAWSRPREVNTSAGPRNLRTLKIAGEVAGPWWKLWGNSRDAIKEHRFSASKKQGGEWEVCHWQVLAGQFEADVAALDGLVAGTAAPVIEEAPEQEPEYPPLTTPQAAKLFEWQRLSCQRLVHALRSGNAIDASQTGAGKTFVAIAACAELGITPYVIAPLAVLEGWRRAAVRMDYRLGGVINYDRARMGSCEYIRKLPPAKDEKGNPAKDSLLFEFRPPQRRRDLFEDAAGKAVLIFDECQKCFPYEAMVQTEIGPIQIGEIVEQKRRVRVAAYDEKSGRTVYAKIANYWTNGDNPLVTINHENGILRCTGNHKIWTQKGWKAAQDLAPGDMLKLFNGIHAEDADRKDMRLLMRRGPEDEIPAMASGAEGYMDTGTAGKGGGQNGRNVLGTGIQKAALSPDEGKEPNAFGGRSEAGHGAQNRGDVSITRGERTDHAPAKIPGHHPKFTYGARNFSEGREGALPVVTEELQGGYSLPRGKAGGGNRRPFTQDEAVAVLGREKNGHPEFSRVDSVTIPESRGGRGSGEMRGGRSLYDIEVEDHHCYFADGVLVHNCKNKDTLQGRILIDTAAAGTKVLLLSATAAKDPMEMYGFGLALGLHTGGKSFFQWAAKHGCRTGTFGLKFTTKPEEQAVAMRKIHKALFPWKGTRVRSADVPGYPENHVSAHLVENDDIAAAYRRMESELELISEKLAQGKLDKRDKASADLAALMRARRASERGKLDFLIEETADLVADGFFVAVFLNFREHLAIMRDALKMKSEPVWGTTWLGRKTVIGIDGLPREVDVNGPAQKPHERQRILDEFNGREGTPPKNRIILVSLSAGGAGINLHDEFRYGMRQSLISPSYSVIDLIQSVGRIWRAGGTKATQRIIFAARTVEEEIAVNLESKCANLEHLNDGDLMADSMAKIIAAADSADPEMKATE